MGLIDCLTTRPLTSIWRTLRSITPISLASRSLIFVALLAAPMVILGACQPSTTAAPSPSRTTDAIEPQEQETPSTAIPALTPMGAPTATASVQQNAKPSSIPKLAVIPLPSDGQAVATALPRPKNDGCERLDSVLLQVVQAPDPVAHAQQLGLRLKDDKIQVLVVLDDEDIAADAQFWAQFGADVGTQSGRQAQAFVPIDQLCDLANAEEVQAVRPPARALPQ